MKKLVVILCIFSLMLNLVSCKTEEVSTKKKVVIKEEDSIEETDETEAIEYEEEEQEPTTSENRYAYTSGNYKLAPWTIEKTVIYSDNDVLITAEELILDYNEEYVGLVINVGNDRTSDITIGIKAFYINNLLCDFYYDDFLTVGACSTEHQIIDVSIDTLKEFNVNDVSQVSIAVKGYTPNNYELINTDLVERKELGIQ